jgi:ribosome-binding protein aMBF1 (putative translation factor)
MTEQKPNIKIIEQLRTASLPQRWLARRTRIHESIISLIVNGRLIPNQKQREAIARALRMQAEELFT